MPESKPRGPLAGVRIIDMTAVVLGPLATQILGDYGADVIKIEPLEGDLMRANGAQKADGSTAGLSSIFLAINRNKRSLAIDLKKEEGRAAVRKLVAGADVFVHNMRVEAVERLGGQPFFDTALADRIVGPLYPVYREPEAHHAAATRARGA